MTTSVDELRYLARTYFHQDYDMEAPTPLGVLGRFRADETAETVAELRADLERMLSSDPGEDDLADLWLRRCGSMYNPTYDNTSFREWFASMLAALR